MAIQNNMEFTLVENPICLVCKSSAQSILGRRGNREYSGANPLATPHVSTNVVRCCSCGFIFCNPKIIGLEHLEKEHYNDPNLYSAYLKSDIYSVFEIGEKILRIIKPHGKLLDIGAGKGTFVSLANMNGYEAKGVEPSERFCKFAKEFYGVEVEVGYLDQGLHFKNEKFDIITLFHVMEHVSSPHKLLKNISNYLKEDGVVYIEVPNANACLLWIADIVLRLCGKKWSSRLSPLHAPFHSMGYSPKSLKYLLENNGFQIVYSGTFSGSVRGYDTGVRVNWVLKLFRDLAVKIVNLFPNRELTVVVANKSNINLDFDTVASFGDEWSRFDQSNLSPTESLKTFNEYFSVFPWHCLPKEAVGFDMGCGTGRWAKIMASRVGHLHCVEPSSAIDAAKGMLQDFNNVSFHKTSLQDCPLTINSQDFGYSLGVLHHLPDTEAALRSCVSLLKPGAPFLVYLYYSFDNRSLGFKLVWRCSDMIRHVVSKLPANLKNIVTDIFALILYYPLSRTCLILEHMGISVESIPLSYYRKHSFYTMRTDSRDRFGTPLEKRFTRKEIASMMGNSGLENVHFSDRAPYWCAVGIKK